MPARRDRRTAGLVVAVTVLALIARFAFVGDRVAHWDEARVAYWTLDYMQTGHFEYRPIIHGPWYHHVNRLLFSVFGVSDAVMRYSVALVGGLLPLSALLLRERLRPVETVALAAFLALNPALLYYSRFMRGDVLVAAFMFAAFAFGVRAIDTGHLRHWYGAVAVAALAFTAKENALLYPVCWIGAGVLLLDARLYVTRAHGDSVRDRFAESLPDLVTSTAHTAWTRIDGGRDRPVARGEFPPNALYRWGGRVGLFGLAVVEFLVIVAFFYAPRTGDPDGVGFNRIAADPGVIDEVLYRGTVGAAEKFYGLWIAGDLSDHAYLPYLVDLLRTIGYDGGAALVVLAVLGFAVERYTGEQREIVAFASLWGFFSVLGYPIVTDIMAPWQAVHVLTPLAIPGAIAVGRVVTWGHEAFVADDRFGVGLAALVILSIAGLVVVPAASAVYVDHSSPNNELVQFAQPEDDIHPEMDALARAADGGEEPDLLLYGDFLAKSNPPNESGYRPVCSKWFNALPLPWYFERAGVDTVCAYSRLDLDDVGADPPVVIAKAVSHTDDGRTVYRAPNALRERFGNYSVVIKQIRTTGEYTAFMIDTDRVPSYRDGRPPAPPREVNFSAGNDSEREPEFGGLNAVMTTDNGTTNGTTTDAQDRRLPALAGPREPAVPMSKR